MDNLTKVTNNSLIQKYGKLKGWDICNSIGLPSFGDVYILRDYIDIDSKKIIDIFGDEPLLCRTDAPIGYGNKLIRGRDVKLKNINEYLREVKKIEKEAVILVSKHPSVYLVNRYIPRYKTNGAIMVIFEKNDKILIDYVGKGFDAGDITRGRTIHSAIQIPWENINEKPKDNYRYARSIKKGFFQISEEQYLLSRENRLIELTRNLKEENFEEIERAIPKETPKLSYKLFEKLYKECIDKVLYSVIRNNDKPYGIMLNIYEDKFCVFEVWNIERSLIKNINIDRIK